MAATLKEIREGIAASLAAVYGTSVQTSAYALEQLTPPTLQVIGPDQVMYDRAFASGLEEITITIQGFGGPMLQGAQVRLDEWLDPNGILSVKAAVEADRTLGGKVLDTVVTEASNYRLFKLADGTALQGCEWQVRVLNRGA